MFEGALIAVLMIVKTLERPENSVHLVHMGLGANPSVLAVGDKKAARGRLGGWREPCPRPGLHSGGMNRQDLVRRQRHCRRLFTSMGGRLGEELPGKSPYNGPLQDAFVNYADFVGMVHKHWSTS